MDSWDTGIALASISFDQLDLLCSRFDVDRRLCSLYPEGLRRRPSVLLEEASAVQYLKFAEILGARLEASFDWKFLNTLLKLCDSGKLGTKSLGYMEFSLGLVAKEFIRPIERTAEPLFEGVTSGKIIKKIPFTLLVADHAVSFAYVWALRFHGLVPEETIVFDSGSSTNSKFRRKTSYTFDRWARGSRDPSTRPITKSIGARFSTADFLPKQLPRPVHSGSVNDPALQQLLAESAAENIIFSAGGAEELIAADTFLRTGKNFLHLHPGVLPGIRGADGLLWSALLRQKAGISAFWMREGIDTGPVVYVEEYPFPNKFREDIYKVDPRIWYRNLLTYYDPFLRARTLVQLLSHEPSLKRALSKRQEEANSQGSRQYHSMHPTLRDKVLESIVSP